MVLKRMENYSVISNLGSGKYGIVYKAIHCTTSEIVAIKRLYRKYASKNECIELPELQSLLKLNGHPNIVKLKEYIYKDNEFFFVFELMESSLQKLIIKYFVEDKVFLEIEVCKWMFQILKALEYIHKVGYFHRDLKPENLLVFKDVIKIADFGMAKETDSNSPHSSNVTTQSYRAPEVLLQSKNYGTPIDMWAIGVIMVEFFTLSRLFPSTNNVDQLHQICVVFGAPTKETWPDGLILATSLGIEFPTLSSLTPLSMLIPNASPEAISLISAMCSWNPSNRPTPSEALQHPFFQGIHKEDVPFPMYIQDNKFEDPLGLKKIILQHGALVV